MGEVQWVEFNVKTLDFNFSIISEKTMQPCEDLNFVLQSEARVVERYSIYLSYK